MAAGGWWGVVGAMAALTPSGTHRFGRRGARRRRGTRGIDRQDSGRGRGGRGRGGRGRGGRGRGGLPERERCGAVRCGVSGGAVRVGACGWRWRLDAERHSPQRLLHPPSRLASPYPSPPPPRPAAPLPRSPPWTSSRFPALHARRTGAGDAAEGFAALRPGEARTARRRTSLRTSLRCEGLPGSTSGGACRQAREPRSGRGAELKLVWMHDGGDMVPRKASIISASLLGAGSHRWCSAAARPPPSETDARWESHWGGALLERRVVWCRAADAPLF